jgi:hypothetical protein
MNRASATVFGVVVSHCSINNVTPEVRIDPIHAGESLSPNPLHGSAVLFLRS